MDDFDDPSDFSCYDLQELDKHMRCPICKELVQTPMILASCSHTFCAGCIRRSMVRELCCPLCREPTNESKLHHNHMLENVLSQWKKTRKHILDLEKNITFSQPNISPVVQAQPRRVLTRSAKGKGVEKAEPVQEVTLTDISVVTCPVCSQTMLMSELNSHIDQCATSDAHAFHPFMPRVTHPQIKSILQRNLQNLYMDLGLDTHGDKRRMIWRHKEYSLLYSINEDSRNPLDARELRQKLKTTESEYFSTQKKIPIATIDPEEYNILLTKKKS
ncbi:hypothetical protein J3Q64DRAFT_1847166 [Phycomyces blakesleeanus]|uniref:Postreplication repair E3 ubiquitin-protein ligase RAD18 n=1 Tax=Phycomyces blakesleeanus TaxID=4837 RepID=A0ABR3B6Z8_PHYBL